MEDFAEYAVKSFFITGSLFSDSFKTINKIELTLYVFFEIGNYGIITRLY